MEKVAASKYRKGKSCDEEEVPGAHILESLEKALV